jgi:hypothetical protein
VQPRMALNPPTDESGEPETGTQRSQTTRMNLRATGGAGGRAHRLRGSGQSGPMFFIPGGMDLSHVPSLKHRT